MAEHYKVELGHAIRKRREELGLTQKQLAERTHHQEAQTVSRWERGENAPTDVEVVAAALEWTVAELVAGIQAPSARTARKLGQHSQPPATQLDRIEQMLTEIRAHLLGAPAEQAPAVAGVADRLVQAASSPPSKAGAQRGKSPAATRRRTA